MGRKSKATQSRALNFGGSSKNPPNVMASDDDDNNNTFVLETLNPFATLTTILQCLGGLREWRHLFINEASGLRMDSMQCPGFKCEAGAQHCCCCHLLFIQLVKSHSQMTLESFGNLVFLGFSVSSETWKPRICLIPEQPQNPLETWHLNFLRNLETISFPNGLRTLWKLGIPNSEIKSISILITPDP